MKSSDRKVPERTIDLSQILCRNREIHLFTFLSAFSFVNEEINDEGKANCTKFLF